MKCELRSGSSLRFFFGEAALRFERMVTLHDPVQRSKVLIWKKHNKLKDSQSYETQGGTSF